MGHVNNNFVWMDLTSSLESVWRPLDTSEALFATFNAAGAFLSVNALDVHGPVTEPLLLQALAHIEKRHPMLRARIIARGDSLYWIKGNPTPRRVSMVDQVPLGGLKALTEIEVHRTYNPTERLWRGTWVPISEDRHWIILSVHHAVADGISGMIIVRDLIATCAALLRGKEPPSELPEGRTLDEVLPPISRVVRLRHQARRLRSRLLGPMPILPIERSAPVEERRTEVIFGSVPGDIMRALRAAARGHGATINGVLSAALLESVLPTLRRLPLVPVTHPVSMRGTAIPMDQVGCFTTNIVTLHRLRDSWSFWREARSATEQLHRALRRGDGTAALLATRGKVAFAAAAMKAAIEDRRTAGRVGAINIANRGLARDLSADPFRVVAWYPAASNHTYGNGLQISCATVGETFFFSLMHVVPLLSGETAQSIANRFVECLTRRAVCTS